MATVIEGKTIFAGDVVFGGGMTAPADSIGDDNITRHRHRAVYAQESATAGADESRVVHVVYGATGVIKAFKAGSVSVAVGDSVVTVDLKKNGASVLSDPVTLDNSATIRTVIAAALSTTALVAGDVLEVVIDATVGTGTLPNGVFCYVEILEDTD